MKNRPKNNPFASENSNSRREFCKKSALASGAALFPFSVASEKYLVSQFTIPYKSKNMISKSSKSIIGPYGPWLADHRKDPGELSFRHATYSNVKSWKNEVLPKVQSYIGRPDIDATPAVRVTATYQYDGLDVEEMEWSWPYGHPTKAILLKPQGAQMPLPAVLGLHDHGGNKYFGCRKITKNGDQHPMMTSHQERYYEGRAWANELAKRGYVVLVHDVFTFASRRVRYHEMGPIPWGDVSTKGRSDDNPESQKNIDLYNDWASAHEHVMAKSLFCGGTTWPGMFLLEDQVALGILAERPEVDEARIGCAGLSGGGLRTNYLGGLDHRIKCAVSVGFMSTWDDFMLHKSYTHTWMTYIPLLPKLMEFPEILALRAPLPTMSMSTNDDQLYTLPEMKKAVTILEDVFTKADASDKLSCRFYPGPHKFDAVMQQDAFDWFDRWL